MLDEILRGWALFELHFHLGAAWKLQREMLKEQNLQQLLKC